MLKWIQTQLLWSESHNDDDDDDNNNMIMYSARL